MSSNTATPEQAPPEEAPPEPSLWRHRDFLRLWTGQSVSLIGTQTTLIALPLAAVTVLNASAVQLGFLTALGQVPYLLILFFGVWADRVRRRPLMITCDIARGLLILIIPVAYLTHDLSIGLMYGVIVTMGLLTTIFDVSWSAFLPSLVPRHHLAEANSRMQLSESAAQVAGPGLIALLLQFMSVALAMFVDSASYFISAALCLSIRKPEHKPAGGGAQAGNVIGAIRAGLRLVLTDSRLRVMLLAVSIFMFFMTAIQTLYYKYAYHQLGVPASVIALILTLAGPGAILGSMLGPRIIRKIGLGQMCVIAAVGGNTSYLLIPLAAKPVGLAVTMLAVAQFLFGFTMPLGMISMVTMRQAITPDNMQGRVTAAFNGFSLGLAPLGALAAGFAGAALGLRPVILIAAIGILIPVPLLFVSPIPRIKGLPDKLPSPETTD